MKRKVKNRKKNQMHSDETKSKNIESQNVDIRMNVAWNAQISEMFPRWCSVIVSKDSLTVI